MKAQRSADRFLARLWALEATLVEAGLPPMPAWWRREIERFYRSGKRRWVIRKGRRVYASTCVAPRLSVAEALFGEHQHVPGTPPITFAFLSVKRDEAGKRLRGISAILDVLGEKYTTKGETIELADYPAIFAVVTASARLSVGDTIGFCWCDEVTSWSDDDLGANPAELVVGRISPALATLPDARMALCSSPLATDDYHARQFDQGETDLQCVSFGETWTINPSLSEAETHALEPDNANWLREYAARPQKRSTDALPDEAIDRAFATQAGTLGESVLVLDPSSGKHDTFTYCRAGWAGTILRFERFGGIAGSFWDRVSGTQIADRIGALAGEVGAHTVISDQREALMLSAALVERGLIFREFTWTNQSKTAAVMRLRGLLASGQISFEVHDQLRRELRGFEERLLPSGAYSYQARRAGLDDFVALILTACMADLAGQLPSSPLSTHAPFGEEWHDISDRAIRANPALGGFGSGGTIW